VGGAALAQRPGGAEQGVDLDTEGEFQIGTIALAQRGGELRFAGALEKVLTRFGTGDPARGAGLIVALATDPAHAGRTGGYHTVRGARRIAAAAPGDDPALQADLWRATELLLGG
jgi:hypothetical protein